MVARIASPARPRHLRMGTPGDAFHRTPRRDDAGGGHRFLRSSAPREDAHGRFGAALAHRAASARAPAVASVRCDAARCRGAAAAARYGCARDGLRASRLRVLLLAGRLGREPFDGAFGYRSPVPPRGRARLHRRVEPHSPDARPAPRRRGSTARPFFLAAGACRGASFCPRRTTSSRATARGLRSSRARTSSRGS